MANPLLHVTGFGPVVQAGLPEDGDASHCAGFGFFVKRTARSLIANVQTITLVGPAATLDATATLIGATISIVLTAPPGSVVFFSVHYRGALQIVDANPLVKVADRDPLLQVRDRNPLVKVPFRGGS